MVTESRIRWQERTSRESKDTISYRRHDGT